MSGTELKFFSFFPVVVWIYVHGRQKNNHGKVPAKMTWQGLKRQLAGAAVCDGRCAVANEVSPLHTEAGTDRCEATKAESPAARITGIKIKKRASMSRYAINGIWIGGNL